MLYEKGKSSKKEWYDKDCYEIYHIGKLLMYDKETVDNVVHI
jgi:hypothetical protein